MRKSFLFLPVVLFTLLTASNSFAVTIYGTAYVGSSGPATLYTIDPSSGVAMPIGLTGYNRVGAIDFDPLTGVLYGIGTDAMTGAIDLITISTTTGMGTTVGSTGLGAGLNPQDISFRSDGTLFGVVQGQAYTFNLTTGAAAALPNGTGQGYTGSALAFDASNTLYNINLNVISTINQTTGTGTPTGVTVNYPIELGTNPRANAMDYDLTTGTLYASVVHVIEGPAANFIAEIDLATGTVTGARATVLGLDGLAVFQEQQGPSPVPEAMSTLWLALPLIGMFAFRRTRVPLTT